MNTRTTSALSAIVMLAILAGALTARAASPPVVTNVTGSQRAGTKLVDIAYTISDPDSTSANIFIMVSKDSGTTWTVPASTFSGDYGLDVAVTATPTAKAVVWDAGADWDGHYTEHCRVRVLANIVPGVHPIVPIMLYDAKLSQVFADKMLAEGIYVIGFFYPVVPKDKARIRVQVSGAHTKEHLDKAIAAFTKVGKELGVIEGAGV